MWVEDLRSGPGLVVTSSGTYCEAVFSNGAISVSLLSLLSIPPFFTFSPSLNFYSTYLPHFLPFTLTSPHPPLVPTARK